MVTDPNLNKITSLLEGLLLEEPAYFCVQVRIKPTNNIKVFIDGDEGLPIAKCVQFNRQLYKLIEDAGLFPGGDFSLEVSSPGVDEPLQLIRQYKKNIGRTLSVIFTDGAIKEGVLEGVAEADIVLTCTTGKGKKAITEQLFIPFNNIKSATVQIKF